MSRVMFYVQHLLGIGHLKRASLIARGMVDAGLEVAVVLGGPPVPGLDFDGCARILLPAVRAADDTFSTLLDDAGNVIDDAWRDHRAARLLFEFESLRPQVLLLETFPFGRRQFMFELLPLVSEARANGGTRIVSSIRDILVRRSEAERNRKMVAFAAAWMDYVLVHGDPRVVPIEASFPEIADVAAKLVYTGYVAEPPPAAPGASAGADGNGEVIVSVGGGAVGEPLLRAAIAAKPLSRLSDRVWRLVTGPNLPEAFATELAWSRPPGVIVERWRSDLPDLFRRCAVSISQGGYNTVMELLLAGARAVVVPFATSRETEQTLRARILAERGLLVVLDEATLTPETLAQAIDRAAALPPHSMEIDCGGAHKTAAIVGRLCDGHPVA